MRKIITRYEAWGHGKYLGTYDDRLAAEEAICDYLPENEAQDFLKGCELQGSGIDEIFDEIEIEPSQIDYELELEAEYYWRNRQKRVLTN